MTFERLYYNLSKGLSSPKEVYNEISQKDKLKTINFYSHFNEISKEPLKESQLQELSAIVNILQILYNSNVDSPVSDYDYDSLQETLVNMGIPRLTGSVEINSSNKVNHKYTQLRGTLDKVYYLSSDEKRTNKSRKYLDEWIKSAEALYFKKTGKTIDLNKQKIMLQPKFDGCLPARTRILLADGTSATIGDIVDNNLDVEVLSFNIDKGLIEPRKIVNTFKYENDISTRWMKIHAGAINRKDCWNKSYSPGATIYPTFNHHMIIYKDGKFINKLAEDIKIGDELLAPRYILSNIQEQIIRGSLLGDGCLVPNTKSKYFYGYQALAMSHSIHQLIELDTRTVTEVEEVNEKIATNKKKREYRYDLEIEGNHNYFANGLLVHNCSSILEIDDKYRWITRGDTRNNLASDVSHIMDIFNDVYNDERGTGIKFEVMMTEENKDKINEFYRDHPYHSSRQIVTATLNSNEPDFKAEYLYPVPLRIIHDSDKVEQIHPDLIRDFPTEICTFADRETIRKFANNNRYVIRKGMRFRTDGVVMTILNQDICLALGRDNNINNFEVAYKFTEEYAYTKVKDVEFYLSDFGYITPVLVVNDVILKGNTINRISLSNKERFDELNFSYGDDVKVLYDIIPYATIDEKCKRVKHGRKIEFIKKCPRCREKLNLDVVQVRCTNPDCPSRLVGRIMNYCSTLRIQNIGYQTIDTLHYFGFLNDGIRDLYKLKKHTNEIENIEGFGKAKTRKIIKEIEAKRRLNDFDFFGAIGIDNCSVKTFQEIFSKIPLTDFIDAFMIGNIDLLKARLLSVNGIGEKTANTLCEYFKDKKNVKDLKKIFKEITLIPSYGGNVDINGKICFSGLRPSIEFSDQLRDLGWIASDSWSEKDTKYLVVPYTGFTSSKVDKATNKGIPVITLDVLKEILKL